MPRCPAPNRLRTLDGGRGSFPTKPRPGLPGEFVTAHVCAQTRHPYSHSDHCRSKKASCAQRILPSSPSSVNPVGFLQPHPQVSQFVADPILCIPAQSTQAKRPELRRDGCPPPLDRGRNLACFKPVVTHLSSRQVVSRRWASSEVLALQIGRLHRYLNMHDAVMSPEANIKGGRC